MNTIKCSRLSSTYPACPPSYIRLFHAAPCMPSVDVYVNGDPVEKNLAYQQFTGYYSVKPCLYRIEIYPSGKHGDCLLASLCLKVCPKSAMTIAIVGGCLCLLGIQEIYDPCRRFKNRCKAYVRFVNLSPNSPSLDVVFAGGAPLFRNVAYTAHTRYVPVDPGTYVLQLRPAGSSQQGITTSPVTLERCTASTVYAVGYAGGSPPLETVVATDGNY